MKLPAAPKPPVMRALSHFSSAASTSTSRADNRPMGTAIVEATLKTIVAQRTMEGVWTMVRYELSVGDRIECSLGVKWFGNKNSRK